MPSSYVIGSHFEGFIRDQLASGRYASASEVIRDALRLLEQEKHLRALQLTELRQLIHEGIDSGQGLEAAAVFAGLRRGMDEVAKAHVPPSP